MAGIEEISGKTYPSAYQFQNALDQHMVLNNTEKNLVLSAAEIDRLVVVNQAANRINDPTITEEQKQAVQQLRGKSFTHRWEMESALAQQSREWKMQPGNKKQNEELKWKLDYIHRLIRSTGQ